MRAVELTVEVADIASELPAIVAPSTLERVAPLAAAVANITVTEIPPAVMPFDSALTSSVEEAVTETAPPDVSEAVEPAIASVAALLVS